MTISKKLTTAALAGLLAAGVTSAAFAADDHKAAGEKAAVAGEKAPAAAASADKHACKGLNACKGKGPDGKNECKGKGSCATDGSMKAGDMKAEEKKAEEKK